MSTNANALTIHETSWDVLEKVVMQGDLAKLSPQDRVTYVRQLTESLGMNPLTQPFQYLQLQGKTTLYATKNAAEQLRRINGVSIDRVEKEIVNETYVVTIYGHTADGRYDSDMGAVFIGGLKGDALVNAMLKAITKAKRRFTLSLCGLGFLDETEVETIRGARPIEVDEDGVIHEPDPRPIRETSAPIVTERHAPLSAPRIKGTAWPVDLDKETDDAPEQITPQTLKRLQIVAKENEWKPEDMHELIATKYTNALDPATGKASSRFLTEDEGRELLAYITPPEQPEQAVIAEVREQAAVKGLDER